MGKKLYVGNLGYDVKEADPDNRMLVPNPFGTGNSLAVIPQESAQVSRLVASGR